jgi:hypothetical protein
VKRESSSSSFAERGRFKDARIINAIALPDDGHGRAKKFQTPDVEPEVMAVEELFKETITIGEPYTFPPPVFSPISTVC